MRIRINQEQIRKSGSSIDLDDLVFDYNEEYKNNFSTFRNYDSGIDYDSPVIIVSYNGNGWCDVEPLSE